MPTYYAQVSYVGDGTATSFSITYPFIDSTHIHAFLDGVETTAFTISSSTLTFTSAPANGVVVKIERQTPIDARLIDFTDGSVLTEQDLDKSADQNFYIAQEVTDDQENNLRLDNDDKYNANSKVIKNVANPVSNQDVATKYYIENTWLSSTDKANLTTVAGISGAVSTVAGISSAVSGVNSNSSNINTVAGQITPTNNISTIAGINSQITNVANNNADISTVAGQISPTNNISTLAGLDTELSAIYNIRSNITNVDTNSTNINLLAGQISPTNNISTVASLNTQIGVLGALGSEISNLHSISADIQGVNAIASAVTGVNTISSAVSGVNTISTEVQGVYNNSTNINIVANNISDVNSFANSYRIGASDPVVSLDEGDLFYNSTDNVLKYYNGTAWQQITADTDVKVLVSANDTTAGYLNGKLVAGSNITFTENNDAGNETLSISATDNSIPFAIALG